MVRGGWVLKISFQFICGTGILALLSLVCIADPALSSRPVGFVRISVSSNEQKLVSLPLKPLDPSINAVLSGQLRGTTDEVTADRLIKWDSTTLQYIQAFKADGTGNSEIDGKWFSSFDPLLPSSLALSPGEGFFIWNRQMTMQDVFLSGEVVLDATNAVILQPSLNLIGYPFSSSKGSSGAPSPESSPLFGSFFNLGSSDWVNNTAGVETVWLETRPYEDVFPAEGETPAIAGIRVSPGGTAATPSAGNVAVAPSVS